MYIHKCLIIFLCFYEYRALEYNVKFQSPIGVKDGWAFLGHLNENERIVKLTPELRIILAENISHSMEICGVYIHHEIYSLFPFVHEITDKKRGSIQIKLKDNVNYADLMDRYTFQIEVYDCDQPPHFSEKKYVLVEIGSVNGPRFLESSYHFTVNYSVPEGTKIGEISAYERPGISQSSQPNQGICKYDILPVNSVPFFIDKYGSLHTQKVEYLPNVMRTYKFYVRATDCDKYQPRIASVLVIVDIRNSCTVHWEGLPKSIKYIRNSGVMPLFSMQSTSPSLHVCSSNCLSFNIFFTARIVGKNIKFAAPELCKHDLNSIHRREVLCDAYSGAVNLLKRAPDSMKDHQIGGYRFSFSYVSVENTFDNTNYLFGKRFSLTFWMKHGNMLLNDPKQQILCNSDLKVMNRHHTSVFLHNCKLILLIRVENGGSEQDKFMPSEWRFGPLRQVCDNEWHHYGITMNDGNPILQIDGEIWSKPPEVLVERQLKKLPENITGTRLTVGSCYHSKSNEYTQNFFGHLAGMRLIRDFVEAVNTVRCLATCGESLLLPHIVEALAKDSTVTMFSDYVIVRSININDLKLMFSKLSYINTNPLTEKPNKDERERSITIDTEIRCQTGAIIKTETHNISLKIIEFLSKTKLGSEKDESLIEIDSDRSVNGQLNKPIYLFSNVQFKRIGGDNVLFKSCIVRPISYLLRPWESTNWPINIPINHHISSINNSHGLVFEGVQSLEVYQMLMRKIYYVTTKVDPLLDNREFGLICALKGKRYTNEHLVKVQILADDLNTYYVVDDQTSGKSDPSDNGQVLHAGNDRIGFTDKTFIDKKRKSSSSKNPFLLPIIVVLSVLVVASVVLSLVVYYRKKIFVKSALSRKSGFKLSPKLMKLASKKPENGSPLPNVYDDVNSINSDCPESGDEQDIDETEQLRPDDDENSNESISGRIEIPAYMNLSSKAWVNKFNHPVDV